MTNPLTAIKTSLQSFGDKFHKPTNSEQKPKETRPSIISSSNTLNKLKSLAQPIPAFIKEEKQIQKLIHSINTYCNNVCVSKDSSAQKSKIHEGIKKSQDMQTALYEELKKVTTSDLNILSTSPSLKALIAAFTELDAVVLKMDNLQ